MPSKNRQELHSALQRLAIPPNLPNQKIFRITALRGKGQGWKALKDIQPGTPLLDEGALFWVLQGTPVDNSFEHNHQGFSALTCPFTPATPQLRFDANNFEMGKGRQQKAKYGIFLRASRINHSCIPNAHFTWNPDLAPSGCLTVYAIASIPKDAEILVNYRYKDSFENRDDRHQGLRDYNFQCACPACRLDTDSGRQSEERRDRMRVLNNRITADRDPGPPDHTIESLSDLIELQSLLQEERLFYPQLADVYHQQVL